MTEETSPTNDDSEFDEIRNMLINSEKGDYNTSFVFRMLHEKANLRKVYLAVIKANPAIISEVAEFSLISKQTCYATLYKLLELKVVDRVFVMQIINGSVKNEEVKSKFEKWVTHMPDGLKRYYSAKTSYWVITPFGRQFARKAYEFEQEFKSKSKGNDSE